MAGALFARVSAGNKRLAVLHAEAHQVDLETKEDEEARERRKDFQREFEENERAQDEKILQCVYKNTKLQLEHIQKQVVSTTKVSEIK